MWGNGAWPCTGSPACEKHSPADGTLGTAGAAIKSIDPILFTDTEGGLIAWNLFEGLISPARQSGGPYEQGVAESWELSADGRTWTFHLRADARWSNGRAVTADDFVYAWLRKLDPAVAAQGAGDLYWIDGAEAYNQGKSRDPKSVGVRAVDPRTLEVRLLCPSALWPSYLAGGAYLPVPREAIEQWGSHWMEPEHIVTNGPYHLVTYAERDRLELVRSETYWDKANVQIPRVVYYVAEGEAKVRTLYDAGQVQWGRGAVDPPSVPKLVAEQAPDFLIDPQLCLYMYVFNVEQPPFDDVRVRRAFAQALDREQLVSSVSKAMQEPADGPVPSVFDRTQGFPGVAGPTFDPTKARAALADAGYPGGHGFPDTHILYNTMESHRMLAEYLARSLSEVLGVPAKAENMEWKSLMSKAESGEYGIARMGICATDTPFSFLEMFESKNARNYMRYKNKTFDDLFARYRCEADPVEAGKVGAAAEAEVIRDLPILPVYYYTRYFLKLPVLQGLEPHLEDMHPFKYMWWADTQKAPAPHPMPELARQAAPKAP
ncbi:MAG: peptide ABC transporter substrate-binding protein [Myxococcota bacterium]